MDLRNTRTTILNQGSAEEKRAELRDYFHKSFTIDEQLYDTLANDSAFYLRAEPLRHPLIFYLGPTAVFYINKLVVAKVSEERINPHYEAMFAIGVDEMSWDDLDDDNYDWPGVAEVKAYRDQVHALVDRVIETLPLSLPIDWPTPFWAIMMGIEHSRIHLETSSVIIRRLPLDQVRQLPLWENCDDTAAAPQNERLPEAGGEVSRGTDKDHPLYGWATAYGAPQFHGADFQART